MDFLNFGISQSWFSWGLALIIGFPLLVVMLGESAHHLEKQQSPLANPIRFIQRFVIPQLVLLLISTRILELPADNVFVRIVETLLWIFIIYTAVSLFNLLVFSESGGKGRVKAPKLLLEVIRLIIVALGSAIVLSNVWGLELGKMLAAFGVGSIVLGLALQDTFSSLFAGFALLSSKQFQEGDWLQVGEHIGRVIHVNWRSTTLLNRDEDIIIIPNSDLAKGQFVNFSHPYPRHVERVNFDFSFDDAPYKVKEVLTTAALNTPGILHDPMPVVDLISYDEFSVRHQIRFWIEHYTDLPLIRNRFVSSVWYIAKREGIWFPTRAHEVFMMEPAGDKQRSSEQEQILNALRACPLLGGLEPEILQEIAGRARLLPYGKGDAIIQQGKHSADYFILYDGTASEHYVDRKGRNHHLNRLGSGDTFGLVSLVRDSADEISVIADTDAEVVVIAGETTHRILPQHPDIAANIEKLIEARLRELQRLDDVA